MQRLPAEAENLISYAVGASLQRFLPPATQKSFYRREHRKTRRNSFLFWPWMISTSVPGGEEFFSC
jgi:hypothetical protein